MPPVHRSPPIVAPPDQTVLVRVLIDGEDHEPLVHLSRVPVPGERVRAEGLTVDVLEVTHEAHGPERPAVRATLLTMRAPAPESEPPEPEPSRRIEAMFRIGDHSERVFLDHVPLPGEAVVMSGGRRARVKSCECSLCVILDQDRPGAVEAEAEWCEPSST